MQENGRVRAAAGGILALFLVLIVLAFYLGDHGVPRDSSSPTQSSGVIDREINGLEFIRKSLEYSFTGLGALSGSGTARRFKRLSVQ